METFREWRCGRQWLTSLTRGSLDSERLGNWRRREVVPRYKIGLADGAGCQRTGLLETEGAVAGVGLWKVIPI